VAARVAPQKYPRTIRGHAAERGDANRDRRRPGADQRQVVAGNRHDRANAQLVPPRRLDDGRRTGTDDVGRGDDGEFGVAADHHARADLRGAVERNDHQHRQVAIDQRDVRPRRDGAGKEQRADDRCGPHARSITLPPAPAMGRPRFSLGTLFFAMVATLLDLRNMLAAWSGYGANSEPVLYRWTHNVGAKWPCGCLACGIAFERLEIVLCRQHYEMSRTTAPNARGERRANRERRRSPNQEYG
jgi:hypothetical protein